MMIEGFIIQLKNIGRWRWVTFVTVLFIVIGGYASEFKAQERVAFYVSLSGNDNFSGRIPAVNSSKTDGPFATLERARDAIRALKKNKQLPHDGVTVYIRGGVYQLPKTFELDSQDSGTEKSPIIYRAYQNEQVRLYGGKEISGFKPITDTEVLRRIARPYQNKVMQVNLRTLGVTDFGEMRSRGFGRPLHSAGLELFFDDKPMQLARWPNDGWATIASVPEGPKGGKFTYSGDRPKWWKDIDDIWLHGYWTWDWADSYEKIKHIDTDKREFTTYEPHGVYGYSIGKRYYALNILEELDSPGEWYLDRKTGVLYFWLPKSLKDTKVYVSLLDTIIQMKDVSFVIFQGLEIGICRGNAVKISGGNHNLVTGCMLRNIGTVGVSIEGGTNNGVSGCIIRDCGDGGIIISGGDRRSLSPGNNYVYNTHIYNYGRWDRTVSPAVKISGVGNKISNNLIHDAPHSAVMLEGNEHIIEYNEIHHVCMETSDAGAFYMGRDYSQRGNIIRYNYFHDLGKGDVQAIYLDDFTSGTTIFGNIIHKARRGVLIGGGRDNIVQNNIFVDCNPAIHIDARGLTWAKSYFDGTRTILLDKLNAVNFKKPPYSVRYPELAMLYDNNPAVPKGNAIINNISYGGRWLDIRNGADEKMVTIKNNYVSDNSSLLEYRSGKVELKSDSPAFKMGFQRIPVEKIGLLKNGSPKEQRAFNVRQGNGQ